MSKVPITDKEATAVFRQILARNLGPHPTDPASRVTPVYGVNAQWRNDTLALEIRFKSEAPYCCGELGCHFRLTKPEDWRRVRHLFRERARELPRPLTVRVLCVIEDGARVFDFSRPVAGHRGYYEFCSSNHYEYLEEYVEDAHGI